MSMAFLDKLAEKRANLPSGRSFALRLLVIGFLIIIFIFPTFLVQGLINERSQRQSSAISEVSGKWGESQTVIGPILVVPYYRYGAVPKNQAYIDQSQLGLAYFVPESLDVKGNVTSQVRSRGIYKIPLYEGDLTMQGNFQVSDLNTISLSSDKMLWNQAYLTMGGLDLGGLKDQLVVNWNSANKKFVTGDKSKLFQSEVTAPTALSGESLGKKIPFSLKLALRGSSNLFFVPVAKETNIDLTSDWSTPSFDGAFLPTTHEVKDNGFSAAWKVLDVNRNIPAAWTDLTTVSLSSAIQNARSGSRIYDEYRYNSTNYNFGELGVRFYLPVDIYQKNTRSAKYALAVIGLVFLIYFLVEATARRRVNPLQYILVGLALSIFYTLLLSLSEYIAFSLAYLIASVAIVGMIGLFTKSVLKSWQLGAITAAILVFLYGFIFILIQSKDYTLLIGSIGLFIILGVIMYFSRYINWYGEEKDNGMVNNS